MTTPNTSSARLEHHPRHEIQDEYIPTPEGLMMILRT